MKIGAVFLGGWMQRIEPHLYEVYNFMKNKKPNPFVNEENMKRIVSGINPQKMQIVKRNGYAVFDFMIKGLKARYCEDGTVFLSEEIQNSSIESIRSTVGLLEDTFQAKIIDELFGEVYKAGAPTPRVLFQVTTRPVVIVLNSAKEEEVADYFRLRDDEIITKGANKKIKHYIGQRMVVFIDPDFSRKNIEYYMQLAELSIFILDFQQIISMVLNNHRGLWERIDEIKGMAKIEVGKLAKVRDSLMNMKQAISYIKMRLSQMGAFLELKEIANSGIIKDVPVLGETIISLKVDHNYMKHLWEMTENYNNSTIELLGFVYDESQKASLDVLQVIFLLTGIAQIAGLFLIVPLGFAAMALYLPVSLMLVAVIYYSIKFYFASIKKQEVKFSGTIMEKELNR